MKPQPPVTTHFMGARSFRRGERRRREYRRWLVSWANANPPRALALPAFGPG